MQIYSRVFRCRKDGFDFMGQIKIDFQETVVNVEVFNENYFDYFDTEFKVKAELNMENIDLLGHRFDCWKVG